MSTAETDSPAGIPSSRRDESRLAARRVSRRRVQSQPPACTAAGAVGGVPLGWLPASPSASPYARPRTPGAKLAVAPRRDVASDPGQPERDSRRSISAWRTSSTPNRRVSRATARLLGARTTATLTTTAIMMATTARAPPARYTRSNVPAERFKVRPARFIPRAFLPRPRQRYEFRDAGPVLRHWGRSSVLRGSPLLPYHLRRFLAIRSITVKTAKWNRARHPMIAARPPVPSANRHTGMTAKPNAIENSARPPNVRTLKLIRLVRDDSHAALQAAADGAPAGLVPADGSRASSRPRTARSLKPASPQHVSVCP